jgi:hypothetical protein
VLSDARERTFSYMKRVTNYLIIILQKTNLIPYLRNISIETSKARSLDIYEIIENFFEARESHTIILKYFSHKTMIIIIKSNG